MIHTLTTTVAAEVGVTLLNSSDISVPGILYTGITVTYRKNGQSSYTTKTVGAGDWVELGDGIYKLLFTTTELNTPGYFRFIIKGAGFDRYEADLQLIENYQDIAAQIISIKQGLASKVNISDADSLIAERELRLKEIGQRQIALDKRLLIAESAVAALRAS
jgi:hypothetical protein